MSDIGFLDLHHSAFTHPVGEEDRARDFYVGVLGLVEVPKPDTMDRTRGAWFRSHPEGGAGIEIHAIPDPDFAPHRLGHPAILVADLDALVDRLTAAGVRVEPDGRLPGHRRVHGYDFFGNRLEFLQADS